MRKILIPIFALSILLGNAFTVPPKSGKRPTEKKVWIGKLEDRIEHVIGDSAIEIRLNPLCINGILSFDQGNDSIGNDIFKLELTLNPFIKGRHHVSEIEAYTFVNNCKIYISGTKSTNQYTKKPQTEKSPFNAIYLTDSFGDFTLDPYGEIPIETFYFVITAEGIKRYYPK